MFKRQRTRLVISEPDLDIALKVLAQDPHSVFASDQNAWNRKRLIDLVSESLPTNPEIGAIFRVGSRVWGLIQPLGADLLGADDMEGLAVWLLVRDCHTDMKRLTELPAPV